MDTTTNTVYTYTSFLVIPLVSTIYHLIYLKIVQALNQKIKKKIVALINLLIYPIMTSTFISFSLFLLKHNDNISIESLLSAIILGTIFCYGSLILAFFPIVSVIFQEMDMQFFLLSLGCALGFSLETVSNLFKKLPSFLETHILYILVIWIVALILSSMFKFFSLRNLHTYRDASEISSSLIWITSISCGVVVAPVIFFLINNALF